MTRVALCLFQEHDPYLVAAALLVCLVGSAAVIELVERVRSAVGRRHAGWVFLAATGTGTMVWCTHFVAMMAFRSHAPVVLDPPLTLVSLLVAIVASAPGIEIVGRNRSWALAGGALIGASIAAMHYIGMAAYRIDGIVHWDMRYVAASVMLAMLLGAAAFGTLVGQHRRRRIIAGGLLGLAVAALHFTGMAAMSIAVLDLNGGLSPTTMTVLGMTTAVAGLLVLGCAAVSALIDEHSQDEAFRRLRHMALHDGLTDLPNRMSFNEELARRLAMKGGRPCMAVIMLDLSRFKAVNDTYGHQAGDQLLTALAARLTATLLPGEIVARLGGDEFGALISYDTPDQLAGFLGRLGAVFVPPFQFERFTASIGTNIGVALAIHDGRDQDTLLAKADLAMYRAKSAHSDQPCFYDSAMDDAVRDRRELACDLRAAVQAGAFHLHFQVQAEIATGRVTGYEALLRWTHPSRGPISPAKFIPLAEENGDIVPLSVWVLREACFQAALWPDPHIVSVNLSPLHLADPQLIAMVRAALDESGLPAERLLLELTESAIIRDRRYALRQLAALKAMGIAIALDDFGVGYSSLDVLRSFPFDRIKLDSSFVAEIERSEQAVAILRSVVALGTILDMPVLAEGIERPAQLAIVAREGCSAIQGYLIGRPSHRPADPDKVEDLMQLGPRVLRQALVS